ncbi:NADP-dependent oxidoreductase [Phytomonospora sp. NPDC050363]|uniref:NADP-dependent oxidoreductase n=1 Tax=Phytomonospora sp. NPDC050363 TaxID=3155642 RepID=UPI0033C21368
MPRALVINSFGGPEVLEVADLPSPVDVPPGRVRVRVAAAGIQPVDTSIRRGMAPAGLELAFPITLGNDFAGTIEELGDEVSGWAVGDEVLGFQVLACHAEEAIVSADQIVAKPPKMPWTVAGSLSASGQTAHIALEALKVAPGDTLLVHGAAGGVGTIAVQLARHLGATVVGTASERNHEHLRSIGAIPVTYGEGLTGRVREAAPGGVTVAFDAAGGERALHDSIELGVEPARIGTITAYEEAERLGALGVRGPRTAARLAELVELWSAGALRITISRTFRLDEAAEAHRLVEARHLTGKMVFVND